MVGLSSDGKVKKLVNVIRAADKAKLRKPAASGDAAQGEATTADDGDPQSVRSDLSTYLTAVTQNALANNIGMGLRALAYQLALRWIGEAYNHHGVRITGFKNGRKGFPCAISSIRSCACCCASSAYFIRLRSFRL